MSKKGHIPIRMCIGCKERKSKKELVRFVRLPEGLIKEDLKGQMPGRGFYICPNNNCFKKAQKKIKEIQNINTLVFLNNIT